MNIFFLIVLYAVGDTTVPVVVDTYTNPAACEESVATVQEAGGAALCALMPLDGDESL